VEGVEMTTAPSDLTLHNYESEAQGERLFAPDHPVLAKKNIATRHALIQVLQHDWEKFAHALLAVQHQRADRLLQGFFDDCPEMAVYAIAATRENRLYHLGFEIAQPLDLVENSTPYWLEALNQNGLQGAGELLRISKVQRFPASSALQARVQAYTEIMRIWFQAGAQELMLELFDIHRPIDALWRHLAESEEASPPAKRDAQTPWACAMLAPHQDRRLARFFQSDPIWHYALYVDSPSKVVELHADFRTLTERVPTYKLAFAEPVRNNFDGSFYTKLLNPAQGAEIEFVTQLSQPPCSRKETSQ
jgi:hypothetical protein